MVMQRKSANYRYLPCHNRMNMNYFKIQIAMTYIAMTHIDMTYIDKHAHFYTPVET